MAGFVSHDLSEPQEAQLRPVRAELAALRFQRAALKLALALKHNFNPEQPRVPAGQPGGGRWAGIGFSSGFVRTAANGERPLVPGGTYSFPVARNPLDPAGLNPKSLPIEEQQQVADAVNTLNEGSPNALRAMQRHVYRNIPDPSTGAALPTSNGGYLTYYIGPKTGKKRLLVDTGTGQMYYTNNHYLSFWLIMSLGN